MPRPAAVSFRLGAETDRRLADLIQHLELSTTEVIRQAVRRLHDAEIAAAKKPKKKMRTGIARGNTSV